jgi:hypothetical protein
MNVTLPIRGNQTSVYRRPISLSLVTVSYTVLNRDRVIQYTRHAFKSIYDERIFVTLKEMTHVLDLHNN